MTKPETQIDKRHKVYLNIAKELATLSHCVSHKVGVIAVLDGRILATGINGTPKGSINCDALFDEATVHSSEEERNAHYEWSKKNEIHGEMNLIIFCAKHGIKLEGATLYSTLQPCYECVKNLTQVGIKVIVYSKIYDKNPDQDELREMLEISDIEIIDKYVENEETVN
jgi:dCMP deaminase